MNKGKKTVTENMNYIMKKVSLQAKTERTGEILLLLKAFDLDEAIDKIETTYRDELNTSNTDKSKRKENEQRTRIHKK